MKIIDEKGKLFGKLNLIDLVVVILIIAALVVVGVKVLRSGNDSLDASGEEITGPVKMTYTVRVEAQRPELAEWVAEYVNAADGQGEQLMASGDLLDAYIVDCWTEPARYIHSTESGVEYYDPETAAEMGLVDILFVIEANNVEDTVYNTVGTQEVRVGRTHIVKTLHFEFITGVTESCVWEPLETAE